MYEFIQDLLNDLYKLWLLILPVVFPWESRLGPGIEVKSTDNGTRLSGFKFGSVSLVVST